MALSLAAVAKFKALYQREYDIELSDVEAREYAEQFMQMMLVVCRPIDNQLANEQELSKEPAKSFIVPPRDLAVSGGTLSKRLGRKKNHARQSTTT